MGRRKLQERGAGKNMRWKRKNWGRTSPTRNPSVVNAKWVPTQSYWACPFCLVINRWTGFNRKASSLMTFWSCIDNAIQAQTRRDTIFAWTWSRMWGTFIGSQLTMTSYSTNYLTQNLREPLSLTIYYQASRKFYLEWKIPLKNRWRRYRGQWPRREYWNEICYRKTGLLINK